MLSPESNSPAPKIFKKRDGPPAPSLSTSGPRVGPGGWDLSGVTHSRCRPGGCRPRLRRPARPAPPPPRQGLPLAEPRLSPRRSRESRDPAARLLLSRNSSGCDTSVTTSSQSSVRGGGILCGASGSDVDTETQNAGEGRSFQVPLLVILSPTSDLFDIIKGRGIGWEDDNTTWLLFYFGVLFFSQPLSSGISKSRRRWARKQVTA
jgi:hypothetical protein